MLSVIDTSRRKMLGILVPSTPKKTYQPKKPVKTAQKRKKKLAPKELTFFENILQNPADSDRFLDKTLRTRLKNSAKPSGP